MSVQWPDGVTTSAWIDRSLGSHYANNQQGVVRRYFEPEETRPGYYPAEVTVIDDDLGEHRVLIDAVDLDVNNDDDNDNDYAIGKILCLPNQSTAAACLPQHPSYAPSRLRLPPNLDPHSTVRIEFEIDHRKKSGDVELLTVSPRSLTTANHKPLQDGGVVIEPGFSYSLTELGYDSWNGSILVVVNALNVTNGHSTRDAVQFSGKPVDRITARVLNLNRPGGDGPLEDTIRYMNVYGDTFYEHLDRRDTRGLNLQGINGEAIRSMFASELVYDGADGKSWSLKLLDQQSLGKLGIRTETIALVFDESKGFIAAMYHDHVADMYILAFAGTTLQWGDMITNVKQALGDASPTIKSNDTSEMGGTCRSPTSTASTRRWTWSPLIRPASTLPNGWSGRDWTSTKSTSPAKACRE